MKIIIFAGGTGTRLWPLSRKNSPKQFGSILGDKSTLQMVIDRVRCFGIENVFVSTNEAFVGIVKAQIPELPEKNILSEPAKRDLAAAVGLALLTVRKDGYKGTVAVLWADHLMEREDEFVLALQKGEKLLEENSNRFVFLGERPRYANHNLGWIKLGENVRDDEYNFAEWKYRPELTICEKMFESGEWVWNPGYFIFDIDFVLGLYKKYMPDMYDVLEAMSGNYNLVKEKYHTLESISFDDAILEKIDVSEAVVLKVNLGWSDPGTLYALKEALEPEMKKNCEQGLVLAHDTKDSFICNEDRDKLVAVIGLEGMVVVNTKEALLVCHKDDVPKVKELLNKIEEKGLSKYL
ncbi:MAG: sugar phosphate nucleotidyltransferase [bacterium]|nr:sugar phosphate nucleotidyltransferase [bacterium]